MYVLFRFTPFYSILILFHFILILLHFVLFCFYYFILYSNNFLDGMSADAASQLWIFYFIVLFHFIVFFFFFSVLLHFNQELFLMLSRLILLINYVWWQMFNHRCFDLLIPINLVLTARPGLLQKVFTSWSLPIQYFP